MSSNHNGHPRRLSAIGPRSIMLSPMPTAMAVYLHTIDPYAVKLWDGGPVRWYGLSYLLGFYLAYLLIRRVARVGRSTLQPQHAGDLVVTVAIGVVLGGRLGYVLFYRPDMLWTFTSAAPFWDVLAVNKGGMASHGGMIGAILAALYFARKGHAPLHVFDLIAFAAPLGVFFGRIANFVNGELIGRRCSPGLPWAVKFPQEMYSWGPGQFAALEQGIKQSAGQVLVWPDLSLEYQVPQMIDRIQTGDAALARVIEPLLTPRHPSQIYQALLEGLLLFAILAVAWRRPRRPGFIVGLFGVAYSVLRIVGEMYREPDAGIGFQWLGLTRGQWLSVGLLLAGIVLMLVSRRSSQVMGGWRADVSTPAQ